MDKDILDQYIYTYGFPFLFKDSRPLLRSISLQTYAKETSPRYDTIENYIEGFSYLFYRNSFIGQIIMIYEKTNDFICTIINRLFPYVSEHM